MNKTTHYIIVFLIIVFMASTFLDNFGVSETQRNEELKYSDFIDRVTANEVKKVVIQGENISGELADGSGFKTVAPYDVKLIDTLIERKVEILAKEPERPGFLYNLLMNLLPLLLLVGIWIYVMRQMQGGGKGGAMSFGKSRARQMNKENNTVTFEDVAGVEEVKEEVQEIVDFLRDPTKFQKLGGRIPRGVLLTGSPGTGKTLMAKAIAGEAGVPFFSISGSDFVEMFVGVGASRVRDMFEQGKKQAPCIIFIDEIDAVGRKRGAGVGGGNDEREQTLNQLLVEMDGFEGGEGVIVIAATNRPDVLDPALLRPGRFDRQVEVPLPDIRGREQILKVHMRKVPLSDNIEASVIARGTPGFSGADLANLVNEAALFAARANKKLVSMEDFELAKDKVLMGVERRSIVMPEDERQNTAYHESGHAIVAEILGDLTDPVHKVTIIPRGRALGVTMQLPAEDRYSHNRDYLLARIAVLMGGRIAEEVFMKQMTTGASNDFEVATNMAQNMVTRWGMSDSLGPRAYGESEAESYFGGGKNYSDETSLLIDKEVTRIIEEQYGRARKILEDENAKVEVMAQALLEWETIDAKQIAAIMKGEKPEPPEDLDLPSSGSSSNDSNDEGKEEKSSKDLGDEPDVNKPIGEH